MLCVELEPFINEVGYNLPDKIRISVGFPSTGALTGRRRLGECWKPSASADGSSQIFISPVLLDEVEIARVTLHELAHAATPGHKHGGAFVKLCKALGFKKPWTTTPTGDELHKRLQDVVNQLPPYPHSILTPLEEKKKKKTYLTKILCPCGFIARTTKIWVDSVGLPSCACGQKFELVEGEED